MGGVGFIGLGQMGASMAAHLVGVEGGLTVCDLRPEAAEKLVEAGATFVSTPAEVADAADIVSIMVLDDDQVRDVVDEMLPIARPDAVFAIHSTIRAQTAIDLAEQAAFRGVNVIDAPVSGGFMGAAAGTLAALVGGEAEVVERARIALDPWAAMVVRFGSVGAGTRAKLARNMMHFVAFTAALEAAAVAEAAGIDLGALAKVVKHTDGVTGGPGAILARPTTAPIPADDEFWYPIMCHTRTLGEKDLTLAIELGNELGIDVPLARLGLERFATNLGVPHEGANP